MIVCECHHLSHLTERKRDRETERKRESEREERERETGGVRVISASTAHVYHYTKQY